MKIGLLGGLRVENDGRPVVVTGTMQLAVLFRLAVDAGTAVSYRAIAEDVWGMDAPENTRAALQSIVSRLRSQLPPGSIESTAGGYRLAVGRRDVDALAFVDLVAAASAAPNGGGAQLASDALALWTGEPWAPSENFDWFERDLRADHARAVELGGVAAASAGRSGIPAPLTSLIGRERELESIRDQLAVNRVVTIIGTGGVGKTRLALESARDWPGAILVELASVGRDEVLAAILAATGREIRTADSAEPSSARERLLDALSGRDVLLVLDNCEHVIESVATIANDLLGVLPRLTILATSREPVGVAGEAFVSVGSLGHPPEAELDREPTHLADYPAVELFAQRAAAATARDLDERELLVGARICARLDGLPLALELAAAKLRTMGIDEVLDGLESRFTLLTGGLRTVLPRHQTLRAMIDWSWSLLSTDERAVLSGFAVYPAGASVSDAAALATTMYASPTAFESLVDRSLLQRSGGRYRALETIREYGLDRLAENGLVAEARAAQVRHMAQNAALMDRLLRGPRVHDAIEWFDAEDDNISAALRFGVQTEMAEEAVLLGISCAWYWVIRDREADSRQWITAIVPLAAALDSDDARVIQLIGPMVSAFSGAAGGASEDAHVDIFSLLPADPPLAGPGTHEVLQLVTPVLGAFAAEDGAPGWMARVTIPRGEELGLDPWPCAVLNVIRAAVAQNRGDIAELGEASALGIAQFEALGDWWGLALAQQMRSEWLVITGALDEALALTDASTDNMRRITSSWDLQQQQSLAVSIMVRQGRTEEARRRAAVLLSEAEATGNVRAISQALVSGFTASIALGDRDHAAAQLARFDEIMPTISNVPAQIRAWAENARAGIALLDGDTDAAEHSLREAVDSALTSADHPVIGMVALNLGNLALARGDIPEALRALDLSTAIVGAYDATSPQVAAIERAAREAGVERTGETPTRPAALESLQGLVGS